MMENRTPVFVDYLDCTFAPEDNPVPDIESLLVSVGGSCDRPPFGSKSQIVWVVGRGKLVINENSRWVRISASGAVIDELRLSGAFEEYVNILGTSPNRVTRLDVSVDVYVDAPELIKVLRSEYPSKCCLSKKPVKTRWFGSTREDGEETGSFYIGDRRNSKVSAVVYDKQHEALERRDELIPPTTRYEVRLKGGVEPCLADALDPTPVFWHYAGGTLLPFPDDPVDDWVQGRDFDPWVNCWSPPTPASTMITKISDSPELRSLAKLAVQCGPSGLPMLKRLVDERLDSYAAEFEREAELASNSPVIKPEPPAKETLSRPLRP